MAVPVIRQARRNGRRNGAFGRNNARITSDAASSSASTNGAQRRYVASSPSACAIKVCGTFYCGIWRIDASGASCPRWRASMASESNGLKSHAAVYGNVLKSSLLRYFEHQASSTARINIARRRHACVPAHPALPLNDADTANHHHACPRRRLLHQNLERHFAPYKRRRLADFRRESWHLLPSATSPTLYSCGCER